MSVYDTFGAGLSALGFGLLGAITVSGTSDFHQNANQLEATLQTKAQQTLEAGGFAWASIEMNGQRATIKGAPPSAEAAAAAEQAVLKTGGRGGALWGPIVSVSSAAGDTVIIAPQPKPQELADQPILETVSPYVWRAVKSPDGKLVYVGSAPDQETSDMLASHLAPAEGFEIDNRVEVAAGAPEGDWAGIAKFGLDQLQLLDSGEARLRDQELRLSGIAMDDAARIQVSAAVSNIAEPWTGIARITGPSLWKAEHVGNTLVLSGNAETADDKTEIANIANQYYDGEVVDQMTVASSQYDNWIDGVRVGLPHFTQFENGEMAFDPTDAGFKFEGEATPSTLQFLREDMAGLEGDYDVDLDVETIAVELDELAGINFGSDPLIACQMSFDLIMQANKVMFQTGSASISRESGETLDKIMAVSETCADSLRFEIGGHTDNTGTRDANIALSRARAQAVANYMVTAEFNSARLIVEGYGPDRPSADNATPEGRADNRRIEFIIQEWSE
jgi:OOP family OmpA-OmpF porin